MLYFVLSLIFISIILNKLSQKYAFSNLSFKRIVEKKCVEIEDEFDITIIIDNNKILPVTFFKFSERLPLWLVYKYKAYIIETTKEIYHAATTSILPFQRIKRHYKVYFKKRGNYSFNTIDLIAGDLLGFKTSKKYIEEPHDIIVLPKLVDLNKYIIPLGNNNGDISVKRWIMNDPTLIVGIREYTGFEPQKAIHWPSSLKSGQLMVKQFDYTSDNSVMIILNIETSRPLWMNIDKNKIETCISISRSIIEELKDENIPYGFVTNAQSGQCAKNKSKLAIPCCNSQHYNEILENLCKIVYDVSTSFDNLLNSIIKHYYSCGTYIVITPTVFKQDVDTINNLHKTGSKIILISLSTENTDSISKNILTYTERIDTL